MTIETLGRYGFDRRDIARAAGSPANERISNETIPTFVLGTVINAMDSTFKNIPVFHLKNLDDAGLLDLNRQSAAQDDLSIKLTSNKSAATVSEQVTAEVKAAANLGGIIGVSAAVHYDHANSTANSDGNVYVAMQRGKHGSYYQINTRDLHDGFDFTPYLIGSALSKAELEKYIAYKSKTIQGKSYISELQFGGYDHSGLIGWDQHNIYGNIQLLTRMEEIFALLLEQYRQFEHTAAIKELLYRHLATLRNDKIHHAVKDFYAHVGTHFVSKLYFANYAYGYGTLSFSETDGNNEARIGANLSLNGSIPEQAAGQLGASAGYARKHGWAKAMKNLSVEAHTRPADIVDIAAFADDIRKMLNDEDKALSVPNLGIPESPKVELLDLPKVDKEKLGPPDSVFASYAEWKQYCADTKKDRGGGDKTTAQILDGDRALKKKGAKLLQEKDPEAPEADAERAAAYRAVRQTLDALEHIRPPAVPGDANLLRIDDMFVAGYATEAYETVIPSLRTGKLKLPERQETSADYPNITRLFLVIDLFRQLHEYLRFIGNFSVSNIDAAFIAALDGFARDFADDGNDLISRYLVAARDIPREVVAGLAITAYGDDGKSKLLAALKGNRDRFAYLMRLLDPALMAFWRDAPGGYMPIAFKENFLPAFAAADKIAPVAPSFRHQVHFDLTTALRESPADLAAFYRGRTESPWYPIFRYDLDKIRLVFLQLVGRYQLIYGRNGVIMPMFEDIGQRSIDLKTDTLSHRVDDNTTGAPIPVDVIPTMDQSVIDALMPALEGFDPGKIDTGHALAFNAESAQREKDRVLLLRGYADDPAQASRYSERIHPRLPGGRPSVYKTCYALINLHDALLTQFADKTGNLIDIASGKKKLLHNDEKLPLLLPIDYSRIAADSGPLPMGSDCGAGRMIGSPTYDAATLASVQAGG